jgi:tetratricopeptide (TPR) repeat protein
MNKIKILGMSGVGLLGVGTFLPIVDVPVAGGVTYFRGGQGDGIFILIFAVLGAFFIYRKFYRWLLFPGAAALVLLTYGFFNLQRILGTLESQVKAESAGVTDSALRDTVAGMADTAVRTIHLQWGWAILLAGALLLIAAGLLKPELRTDSITEAIKRLDPSVLKKLPFSRKQPSKKETRVEPSFPMDFTASIAGDDSRACCIEGRKYLISKNFEQALAAFSKAVDLDPTNRSAYYHRGLVYQKLGQKRLAQSDFQAAAEMGHRTARGLTVNKKFF